MRDQIARPLTSLCASSSRTRPRFELAEDGGPVVRSDDGGSLRVEGVEQPDAVRRGHVAGDFVGGEPGVLARLFGRPRR
jgi:hypothetical protein